jgi:hypothetical protein
MQAVVPEPAFPVAPHIRHEGGTIACWYTEPPGAVVQLTRSVKGTVPLAEWMVGAGYDQLIARYPTAETLILVLDIRAMVGRDPAARSVMLEKARSQKRGRFNSFIVPPTDSSKIYLTTLHAAAALVNTFGSRLQIVKSLREVIVAQKLCVAPR